MSFILTILCFIISVAIPVSILYFTGFEIIHFSLFFVIPVGALFVGFVCGYGYFKGLFKAHKQVTLKHFIIGFIISLLCIFSIEYLGYQMTCIDESTMEIYYSFSGDHISNYEIDNYGVFDFLTFKKYMIENTPISFSHHAKEVFDVSNPIVCWIFAIVDMLGIVVGCLYNGLLYSSKPFCKPCKKYKQRAEILNFKTMFKDDISSILDDAIQSDFAFAELVSKYQSIECNPNSDEHFKIVVIYCDECKTSELKFELYQLNSKKQLEENLDFKYSIPVQWNIVKNFIPLSSNVA